MPKVKKALKKGVKDEPIENKLWQSADKLRKNMDAAEYKHVVLGLIFLKYISDAFDVLHAKLAAGKGDYKGANPEDPNEYTAERVFYVPPIARWKPISDNAKKTEILLPDGKKVGIGGYLDEAMEAIERRNPSLKGVLPKVFARPNLDRASLGGLIDLIGTIELGSDEAKRKDVLGQVYEYFLGQFALAEGKKGGQFYTPRSVVSLLVEMLEPYEGRVFDPCCGSGGMFVQSEKFIAAHQDHYKKKGKGGAFHPSDLISIYGQESNLTTWRLAKMNLSIRGIDSSNIKTNNEGSFLSDAHKDLKADFVIANPPFNDSDWSGELLREDARWAYGAPPVGNANYAWIQ
ncbi:MAG TPA: class I SAM-dependent DNA methyltransferase, partial [bacterium]|nr:class I SAM-dependent DNA methyltransferase [bacterium]